MLIPCRDGVPYLFRLRIVQTPWFGIYLHDIYEDDEDRDPHNHPWSFASVVLRGYYVERVYPEPTHSSEYVVLRHRRGSVHRMGTREAHRIVDAAPGLKTLIFVGPRQGGWGFFCEEGFVAWERYEHRQKVAYGARP
jgi:hypothetical protein